MNSTSIDDLPVEMIRMLFEHLPLKDLVACSMVNKLWYSIYLSFKVQRLVAIEYDSYDLSDLSCVPRKWSNPDRRIEAKEQCSLAIFHYLTEEPLLSNLKYLLVSGLSSELALDLDDLNLFKQLVHLELYIDDSHEAFWEISWAIDLNLPKLEVLVFHRINQGGPLLIDCPLLSTLVYPEENDSDWLSTLVDYPWLDNGVLQVNQPETIRKLQTNMHNPKWLAGFENVECLVTEEIQTISKATLLSLPKLKDLRYTRNIENLIGNWLVNTVDHLKRTLNEFMDEVKRLRGSDFRFTFAGFQLSNVDLDQIVDIDKIDFGVFFDQSGKEYVLNEYVYMKNYHLIEPGALHFVEKIYYTYLLRYVTEEFPRCFSQKFTGIEEVVVHGVVKDPDHLLWFLKSLRFLTILGFKSTGLSQEFYDQLPAAARSLIGLEFRGDSTNDVQVNFNFLNDFSSLSLEFKQTLSFESAVSLVRSSVKLAKVCFDVRLNENYSLCTVNERGLTVFKILKRTQPLFETENLDEIADFLERFRASVSH